MTIPTPALSVVLATPGDYEMIRRTIGFLRSQTVVDRLELVVVVPLTISLDQDELEQFSSVEVVCLDSFESCGSANAAGVRAAHAPVVVLAEDHAFPDPDWAEVLIEAHGQGWAAVGPAVRNGNPRTRISRADEFDRARYVEPDWDVAPVPKNARIRMEIR